MNEMWLRIMLVGAGGFVGSAARYLVSGWVQQMSGTLSFPYGTVAVNLAGCFAIGILGYLVDARDMFSEETRTLLLVGVLGGFTTFSTFGSETISLLRHGFVLYALANVAVQVVLGLALVWAGRAAAELVIG
ncbi:MAG: fluoride efflux transporter CrcB [Pyrinomonadaceae bacterium]